MPYSCKDDYITFLLNLIDEFQASIPQTKQPGHPFGYENRYMICFFIFMIIKRCFAFKAMNRWLKLNPDEDKSLFKAKEPVWHKKDMHNNHIPKNLRNL